MHLNRCSLLTIIVSILLFSSCEMQPGDGGTSMITGKIYVNEINSSGIIINEYYAQNEHVYLIYGDKTIYDDETQTSYEGSYQFRYLKKGSYKIFAYSDCLTCPGGSEAIIVEAEITDNRSEINIPDIIINKKF